MATKHWSWGYFTTDHLLFRNNNLGGMNSFWRGGIENLEKEMEACEILNSSGDSSDGIQPEIPTTLADFM
jgi:hypothetical protein